jgi:hypothetical protein
MYNDNDVHPVASLDDVPPPPSPKGNPGYMSSPPRIKPNPLGNNTNESRGLRFGWALALMVAPALVVVMAVVCIVFFTAVSALWSVAPVKAVAVVALAVGLWLVAIAFVIEGPPRDPRKSKDK